MRWRSVLLLASLGTVLIGCERGTFCNQCSKRPAEPTKIDWTGLSEELRKVDFGKGATIKIENAEVACPPSPCLPSDCCTPSPEVELRYTLLYENARLIEEEVTTDSVGVKLAPRHTKRLELLTNALKPCHRADAPVVFHVTGYSSTAEFTSEPSGERLRNSDKLNLQTANLRAEIVGNFLKNKGFKVKTKEWRADDMRRPYRDNAQQGVAQQGLNRTVFLDLESAGACDLRP